MATCADAWQHSPMMFNYFFALFYYSVIMQRMLWAYNLRLLTKHWTPQYIAVLFCSLLDPVFLNKGWEGIWIFEERIGGDFEGFVRSGWRVVENPLHQCGDSEASTRPLLVAPDCAGHVDVHPLNLLINKLCKTYMYTEQTHQLIVLFLRTSDPIYYMGAGKINHNKQLKKMVAVGTCFRNNAAVIAPALGCKGPAASISAMLDSMDSQ